ncbi:hypothetical protein F4806DRAFT_175913 [Annulohypoxylon nitens]|nr:hypothetical protein F4806DRAFT_175913 [Annulohypoxylon nitens]
MSLAPPASKDGFSYSGDMFVESSGHNRHRRATIAELKDHFKSGSDKDHPAHWFEAQCIHYGLQPSKTKAVARMRLFDAVNTGKLSIPSHIKKLETELKKEWTKSEREAKKAIKDASSSTTKSTKRKAAADSVDFTVSVGDINISVSANSAAKKSKTTTTKAASTSTTLKATTPKTASTTKAKAKTPASRKKSSSAAPSSSAPAPSTHTARGRSSRGRGGLSHQGPGRSGVPAPASSPPPPRGIQTARRSRGWRPGSSHTSGSHTGYKNDPDDDDNSHISVKDEDDDGGESKLIGLLNGRYDINITDGMAIDGIELSLVLTLNGSQLWGSFELGCVRGILNIPQRPYRPSYDPLEFIWRGREDGLGKISFGNNHRGRMKFLGDGRIEAEIDDYGIVFTGRRTSGDNTRSKIDAASMRAKWNSYTYELFDEERSYKGGGY